MSKERRQGFLYGTMILSVSTIIVKAVALFYSIPLANMLGDGTMGYYNAAYNIFGIFNAMATAGLPVAVSKMVSSAYAMGKRKQANRIFSVALSAFFVLGLTFSLVMFFFSDRFAALVGYRNASYAIKALAPTVFFCAIMSALRGYFQGRSNMIPTALSQTIEAISRVVIGLSLATYVHSTLGMDGRYSAAAAIVGVSTSAGLGMVSLIIFKKRQKHWDRQNLDVETHRGVTGRRQILKELVKFAVPIAIGACFLYGLDLADASIVNNGLQKYLTEAQASPLSGAWGNVVKLYDIPGAIVIALSTSLLPVLSAALARGDHKAISKTAASAIRITMLITVPCGVGFALLGSPLTALFFTREATQRNGGALLLILAGSVVFNGMLYTTNAIMQSMGHTVRPVVHMAIGGVIRITMNYFLVAIPEINIKSPAIATLTANGITMVLNLIAVSRLIHGIGNPVKMAAPIVLSAALMGAGAYGSFYGLNLYVSARIAVVLAICVAVVLYGVFGILFKAIKANDIKMLPKGEKIVKRLGLYEGAHFE